MKKKLDRREAVRERKALSAAKLERSIEAELIERLKSKAYGDMPLNVNEAVWQAVLDRERGEKEGDKGKGKALEMVDDETDEEDEEQLEEEEEGWGDREFVSDLSGEEDGLSDLEDAMVSASVSVFPHSFSCRIRSHQERMATMMKTTKTKMEAKRATNMRRRQHSASGKLPQSPRSRHAKDQRRRQGVSMHASNILVLSLNGLYPQAGRGWKSSTSTRWRAYHLPRRLLPIGSTFRTHCLDAMRSTRLYHYVVLHMWYVTALSLSA